MTESIPSAESYSLPRPRWTIPSFRRTPGRYPLGLEAVNFGQLDDLASGLPVLSQHPRYWSIYTWSIKRYWDRGLRPQTNAGLGRFMRRQELAFASAALLCVAHDELPGIIGRNAIMPHLRGTPDGLHLDLPYLEQRMGGYGQVYRGGMAALGLVLPAELNPQAPLDAPLGELGASVADAFGAAIADTAYMRDYANLDDGTIPLEVLRELADVSCFHHLAAGGAERDLLVAVLLGTAQAPHPSHRNRAASVRLFLDLARATRDAPVEQERFRRLLYRGAEGAVSWRPTPIVAATWRRWWLVRQRELVVASLNSLFIHLVRWGLARGGAIRLQPLADYARLLADLPVSLDGAGPVRAGDVALRAATAACDAAIRADGWPIETAAGSPQEEEYLARADRGLAADAPVPSFLALLLALRRARVFLEAEGAVPTERAALGDGGEERVASAHLASWLVEREAAGDSVAEAIFGLLRRHVVRQHLRVARSKLPEDTFRFHDEGGALRFVDQGDQDGLNPISIRFTAIASALAELGLVAGPIEQPGHGLTPFGELLLDG